MSRHQWQITMNNSIIWFSILSVIFVSACNTVYDKQVVGNFYLGTVDYVLSATCLYYRLDDGNSIGVVPAAAFAAGFNEDYIIIKPY